MNSLKRRTYKDLASSDDVKAMAEIIAALPLEVQGALVGTMLRKSHVLIEGMGAKARRKK